MSKTDLCEFGKETLLKPHPFWATFPKDHMVVCGRPVCTLVLITTHEAQYKNSENELDFTMIAKELSGHCNRKSIRTTHSIPTQEPKTNDLGQFLFMRHSSNESDFFALGSSGAALCKASRRQPGGSTSPVSCSKAALHQLRGGSVIPCSSRTPILGAKSNGQPFGHKRHWT